MQNIMYNDKYGLTKAVIDGDKTNTRRDANVPSDAIFVGWVTVNLKLGERCTTVVFKSADGQIINVKPRYKVGEIVAVAQPYYQIYNQGTDWEKMCNHYDLSEREDSESLAGWNNKMFVKAELMPHQIRITNVRVERLQDISDDDVKKEGLSVTMSCQRYYHIIGNDWSGDKYGLFSYKPQLAFASLIDKVSGKGAWERNPFVFAYEFELIK